MVATSGMYEAWIWTPLIGFDNGQDDFGVAIIIDKAGFIPKAVSLFICSPDFVHLHSDMEEEITFPADYCSYNAHPFNEERERQSWTNYQLKGLIDELHNYGIDVYLSIFASFLDNKFHDEWMSDHLELCPMNRNGVRLRGVSCGINALKRFRDGTYYEDFFIRKLVQVMRDYQFDGWHGADGYSPPPQPPLYEVDYSDDMVKQFTKARGIVLPEYISGCCDDDPARVKERASWIWKHKRRDWIEFHTDRWAMFWEKVVKALHKEGKQLVINSAWTRAPFEAVYRYGIDYKRIADTGIDAFVVETVAGAADMEFEKGERHYDYLAMLLLIKAYVPGTKLIFLNAVRDTAEQWDLLHHVPTVLEKEVYSLSNLYHYDTSGKLKRCVEGPMVCLGDGIRREEWAWLREKWDLGFSGNPWRIIGPTVVWSDEMVKNQLTDFIATRKWTTHRILYHLMAEGAPIQASIDVRDLDKISGMILVINANLLPENELEKVFEYENGPIIIVGAKLPVLPEPDIQFSDIYSPDELWCYAYGLGREFTVSLERNGEERIPADIMDVADPGRFGDDLYFRKVSRSFIKACVDLICRGTGYSKVFTARDSVRVLMMEQEKGRLRLLAKNDDFPSYARVEVDMEREIKAIELLTRFPVTRIAPNGSRFNIKIPPKGVVMLDVEFTTV